jgi:hypothetical protein
MSANAGIQVRCQCSSKTAWIPAFAGMTATRVDFQSINPQLFGLEFFGHRGLLFFCGHMGAAERFGTVAHEHKRLGADVGDLVIILCGEKDDLVFLDNPFFSL